MSANAITKRSCKMVELGCALHHMNLESNQREFRDGGARV